MTRDRSRDDKKKRKSRVTAPILSLILPGLGQIFRGRVFAGLLFFFNVALYFLPILPQFSGHGMEYDIQTPSVLIAFGCWLCGALDAFLLKSSFLVLALLVALFCFGTGFFGSFFILPHLDI